MIRRRSFLSLALLPLAFSPLAPGRAEAQMTQQQLLVNSAEVTFRSMLSDPDFTALPHYVQRAQALMIFPELIRGGFIVGGEGGEGVLIARGPDGSWGYPAFYTMATGSIGLQIGAQVSQVVLAIMTQRGLQSVLDRNVTLGADISVAAVNVGIGAGARTGLDLNADMYSFQRNQGLFLGGALEGSVLAPNPGDNQRYYGPGATPAAIIAGRYSNPSAEGLRAILPR